MLYKALGLMIILSFTICISCKAIDVSAGACVLYEVSTGKVLFEKNKEKPMEIASTTKIMTAVVVLENTDPRDIITVKKHCTGIEGSSIYLKAGEKITVSDLLHGIMLESGNDAALALADYVGKGDISRFIALMNEKAAALDLKNTHFENPNGLPAEGHYSTACDMARLTSYAMEIPEFREIVSKTSYSAGGRYMKNHNRLLSMYKGADGVKTGFTRASGRCLVSSAVRDGVRLVAVTLSAPNDWNDHINLYNYGYNNYSRCSFLKPGEIVASVPVVGGESFCKITVKATGELFDVLTSDELQTTKLIIYLPQFLYAPVIKGETVGEAMLYVNKNLIGRCNLIAGEGAQYCEKPGFWEIIRGFFTVKNNGRKLCEQ